MSETGGARALFCVGTSHRVASVEFIEHALHGAERYRRQWPVEPGTGAARDTVSELAVLATCNRVELWAAASSGGVDHAITDMREALSAGDPGTDALYAYRDDRALRHLCRVAVGLDSMVVGEPQIAGQVARAFGGALHVNGGASLLETAAAVARRASRRARRETGICRKPASVSTVAVHAATERLGSLEGARVLVVGAGKIGRLACRALRDSGAELTIVNRTPARAKSVAERVGARVRPLEALAEEIARSTVVFTSTASPQPIIDARMLRHALDGTAGRALLLIDIAVPRNVAGDARGVPGVELLGIDDLRLRVRTHLEERRGEIPRAEEIIDEVVTRHWPADMRAARVVGDLRRRAERIRRKAIQRTLADMADIDPVTHGRLEYLSRTLVNRLLHDPTARLRAAAENGRGEDFIRAARDLFALDSDGPSSG